MTRPPVTPLQVGELLGQLTHELQEMVEQLAVADLEATRAKADFDQRFAVAFLQKTGSVEARKFSAVDTTHKWRLLADEAACRVRDIKERIRTIRDRIDVGRSYGAALRAEAAAVNTPWQEG